MNRTLFWFLAAITPIRADLILGSPPDPANGNAYPFGSSNFIGRYQQVYDGGAFTGIVTIGAIGFFHTQVPGGSFTGQTFSISLSTTSKAVNGLDLANGNNNFGPSNSLFTTTVLTGAAPLGELLLAGTPFTYNPALGNLLLTIDISGLSNYTKDDLFFDSRNSTAGGQFSRAMFLPSGSPICCGNDNYGLTTDFRFVPEPSSWLLSGSALIALCGFRSYQLWRPRFQY